MQRSLWHILLCVPALFLWQGGWRRGRERAALERASLGHCWGDEDLIFEDVAIPPLEKMCSC